MEQALSEYDCEQMRSILQATVEEYTPPSGLIDTVWRASHPVAARSGSVVELPARRVRGPADQDGIA